VLVICRIFAHDPTVLPLFERVHGDDLYHPDFIAHSARVFGALESLITLLDQPDTYEMQVAFLRSVHNYRNLAENHIWVRNVPKMLVFLYGTFHHKIYFRPQKYIALDYINIWYN